MKASTQQIQDYLPNSLNYLSTMISFDSLLKLIQHYGGTRIQIPRKVTPCHCLTGLIGMDDLKTLAKIYGGSTLDMPRCTRIFTLSRDIKMLSDRRSHLSLSQIALKYKVTERCVSNSLRRVEPYERQPWINEIQAMFSLVF
ncbi:MAG: Mor transcription activator family protein [Methylococcaceae bacterium]